MADDIKMEVESPELVLEPKEVQKEAKAVQAEIADLAEVKPELVLDGLKPEPEMANIVEVKGLSEEDADNFRIQNFSDEEKQQINDFAEKIDLHDTSVIVNYGVSAQKRLAEFSDTALEQVRNKDIDVVGKLIGDLVADLKYDPDEEEGFFAKLFHRGANKVESAKQYYQRVEKSVDQVAENLEGHQQTLLKDIAIQDMLFENNKTYFKELTMYIAAGKQALQKATNEELPALKAKAQQSGLAEDAQAAKDYSSMIERFEKKIHDLELTRTICLQNAPQIRLIQSNAVILSDKIQTTLVNTLPLWKNQMIITLGLAHSKEAIEAQNAVTNTTNEILSKNAELLHQTSVEIAQANERGIVDMETLQHANSELIDTLNDIMKIQQEGKQKRAAAEKELAAIEAQIKDKMIEMSV